MPQEHPISALDAESPQGDRVVGPLRESRRARQDGLALLPAAAGALLGTDPASARERLDLAVRFLDDVLLPTCRAEEFTFYIAVEGAIGAPGACDVMRAQHESIAAIAGDLGKVAEAARKASDVAAYTSYLLPLLHGAYALIRAHLESEDDAYLPLLDERLSESQVEMIIKNTLRIAGGSKPPEEGIRFPQL